MKRARRQDGVHLEHEGRSVQLDAADVSCLARMTPLGRKVHLRNKAKGLLDDAARGEGARILLEWWRLPARDWSFGLPEGEEKG